MLDLSDDGIEEVVIENGLFRARARDGSPAAVSLQAMIKMADGKWKLEDWSNRKRISYCRATPREDVRQIILVQANTYVGDIASIEFGDQKGVTGKFEVRVRGSCDLYFRVTGGTATEATEGVFSLNGFPCVTTTKLEGPIRWQFAASSAGTIDMTVRISRAGVDGSLAGPGSVAFPGGTQASVGQDCVAGTISSAVFPKAGPVALISKGGTEGTVKLKFIDLIPISFTPDPPDGIGPVPYSCSMPLDQAPPGTIWQDVSLDTLRDDVPFTLGVNAMYNFQYGGAAGLQTCINTYGYSINLQRVNEDGSPLE